MIRRMARGLGAPVASIGGAGTFDGIFVTAIVAVLIAGLGAARPRPDASGESRSSVPISRVKTESNGDAGSVD
jgi:Protein of unknown function (DUF1614)